MKANLVQTKNSFSLIDMQQFPLILREVAAIGVRLSHASLFSSEDGKMLSNTSIICPWVWNNFAKVKLIPDMRKILECSFFESFGAQG